MPYPPMEFEVAQIAERLREQPARVVFGEPFAVDRRADLDRGSWPVRQPSQHGVKPLGDKLAVAFDVSVDVDERSPVTGQGEPRIERVHLVERIQKLSDWIRRPPVVV